MAHKGQTIIPLFFHKLTGAQITMLAAFTTEEKTKVSPNTETRLQCSKNILIFGPKKSKTIVLGNRSSS